MKPTDRNPVTETKISIQDSKTNMFLNLFILGLYSEGPAKSFATGFGLLQCYVLSNIFLLQKKGKRKVQGVPQSQTAALPRPQMEEETDKSKQAQIEQTYEKH